MKTTQIIFSSLFFLGLTSVSSVAQATTLTKAEISTEISNGIALTHSKFETIDVKPTVLATLSKAVLLQQINTDLAKATALVTTELNAEVAE